MAGSAARTALNGAKPAFLTGATAPASGGKGGANAPQSTTAQPAQTVESAAPQMNNPTAPNIMQQSATALTDATQAATAGANYQPMNVTADQVSTSMGTQQVGNQMGSKQAVGAMGQQQVGSEMGSRMTGAGNVTAGQLASTDLGAYTNPYESQVVNQSMADLDRARQIQQMQQNAKMGAAGAFGGSRHGIAQAESNRAFYDRAGAMAGGLRQQGFQNAQEMAQQDLQRTMQADLANQSTQLAASQANQQTEQTGLQRMLQAGMANQNVEQQGLQRQLAASQSNQQTEQTGLQRMLQAGMANQNVEQTGLQRMLQAGLSNQSQGMAAQMANQGAGLQGAGQRLQAAGQLARLSQQGFDMGRMMQGDIREQGNIQQLMQQQLIDAAKQQFAGYTGAPANSLGYVSQALGASTVPQSQTTTKEPGLMDYLTLAATMASSDARLKKNITKLGSLDNGLGVYSWDWTKDADAKGLSNSMRLGFIAQEVQEIMPHNVVTMPSGYLAVKYGNVFEEIA